VLIRIPVDQEIQYELSDEEIAYMMGEASLPDKARLLSVVLEQLRFADPTDTNSILDYMTFQAKEQVARIDTLLTERSK